MMKWWEKWARRIGKLSFTESSVLCTSAWIKSILMVVVIGIPSLLMAEGSLFISWDANTEPDLAGYKIYYGTASSQYDNSVDIGNVTEYRAFDLVVEQRYYFVVTAYDQAGNESDYSEEVSEIVSEPFAKADKNGNDIHIQWVPVENADSYNIYWDTNPYFVPDTPIANVTESSYTDVGRCAEPRQNHYYEVRAVVGGTEAYTYNRVGLYNIRLRPGYNLVSLPLIPYQAGVSEVFGDQLTGATSSGQADQIRQWNGNSHEVAWLVEGTQSEWEGKWVTEAGDTLSGIVINPDEGFWLIIREGHVDTMLAITGSVVTDSSRTIQLTKGINLIGTCYPMTVDLHDSQLYEDAAATGANNSASSDQVLHWNGQGHDVAWLVDGTGTDWDGMWLNSAGFDTTDVKFKPGHGYWIKIRSNHTPQIWTYPNPYFKSR